jgi:hypothetical protein
LAATDVPATSLCCLQLTCTCYSAALSNFYPIVPMAMYKPKICLFCDEMNVVYFSFSPHVKESSLRDCSPETSERS